MRRWIVILASVLVVLGPVRLGSGGLPALAQSSGWSIKAPLPVAKTGLVAVTGDDGRIYVFGGTDNATKDYRDAEVFDPAANTWTAIAPLPLPESYPRAILGNDNKIYIFGGFDSNAGQSQNSVFAYDPTTNTYACSGAYAGCSSSSLAAMPTARSVMAIAETLDGKIYTIGGYTNTPVATVEVYDPAKNTWASGPPLPVPLAGASAVILLTGQIVVFGGFDGKQYNQNTYVLPALASSGSSTFHDLTVVRSEPRQDLGEPVICIPKDLDDSDRRWVIANTPIWLIEFPKDAAEVEQQIMQIEELERANRMTAQMESAMIQQFI